MNKKFKLPNIKSKEAFKTQCSTKTDLKTQCCTYPELIKKPFYNVGSSNLRNPKFANVMFYDTCYFAEMEGGMWNLIASIPHYCLLINVKNR